MATETSKRDPNRITAMLAVTNDSDAFPTMLRIDSTTKRLLTTSTISGDVAIITNTAKDGTGTDLQPIVDADGHFQVDVLTGGGGTQYATNVAYADGNTGTLALAVRDDSLTTLTEADGDYSVLRVSSTGALHVTGGGGGTEYTEDVASANPQVGKAIMMERDDALSAVTPAEGDWIGLRGNANGALWTIDANSATITTHLSEIEGAVETIEGAFGTAGSADSQVLSVQGIASMTPLSVTESSPISGFATSAKQLADGHNVAVSNMIPAVETGLATSAKQLADGHSVAVASIAAGTNVIGKARLVTATGDEITEDTDNSMQVTIVADDVGIGGGVQYDEDTAHSTGDTGTMVLAVENEDQADLSTGDKDYTPIAVTKEGNVIVKQEGTITVTESSPISGFATSALQLADGHNVTVDNSTGASAVNIQDGGNTITVDGTVAVTGTFWQETQPVSVASVPSHAVTNAGTFVVQENGAALTALQLIDDVVYVDDTAVHATGTSKGVGIMAAATPTDGSVGANDIGMVGMSTDRRLHVDAQIVGADGTLTVDGTVTANLSATDNTVLDNILIDTTAIKTAVQIMDDWDDTNYANVNMNVAGTDVAGGNGTTNAQTIRVTVSSDSTGVLSVDDNGGALTVDGTVTANLSATDNTVLDNIDADTSNIQTAVQLIDDAIYVDDADWTADTNKHALVGAVTQVATTANTDGDTTPLTTNAFRELRTAIPESDLATAGTAHVKKYYTASAPTDGIIWSPAAGKRWYITDLIINVDAASVVTIEDDKAGGDEAVMKLNLAANSGVSHSFQTPLYSGEDAADLIITASAGNIYVTCVGYEI